MPSDPGRKSFRIQSNKKFSTFVAMYVRGALFQSLPDRISVASIYVICQKDAGERENNALLCYV